MRIFSIFTQSPRGLLWAPIEVEYDETTGKIGTLPEPLQKFVDGLINQTHRTLRQQVADLETKVKTGGEGIAERERLKALEEENHRFKTAEAERKAEYEKALKIREEADAKREEERKREIEKTQQELHRRDGRLREMAKNEIKIAAKNLGARAESLDELAAILGASLDLDADLQPFVKGPDGKPAIVDGAPVTIEGYVKGYLDTHPHHRASTGGTGGGARGGASLTGGDPKLVAEIETAEEELTEARKAFRRNRNDLSALDRINKLTQKVNELKAKAEGAARK